MPVERSWSKVPSTGPMAASREEMARLGSRVVTRALVIGSFARPRLKKGWPKAQTRPSSTRVTVPVPARARSPWIRLAPIGSPAARGGASS